MTARPAGGADGLRIDKLLWFLRLAPSRAVAQALVGRGVVRVNGRRVERSSALVRCGAIIVLPQGSGAVAIAVDRLPQRRGPPLEARSCYHVVGDTPAEMG